MLRKVKDNKGFSLIELVCTLAIFMIISVIMASTISIFTKEYNNSLSQMNVQQKSMDASEKVVNLARRSKIVMASSYGYYDFLFDVNDGYRLTFEPDEKKLYCNRIKKTGYANFGTYGYYVAAIEDERNEFASGIEEFAIDDMGQAITGRIVVSMNYKYNEKENVIRRNVRLKDYKKKMVIKPGSSNIWGGGIIDEEDDDDEDGIIDEEHDDDDDDFETIFF